MSSRKPLAYICGPMRGIPDLNFPAFDWARDVLLAFGYDPISPADLDRKRGMDQKMWDGDDGRLLRLVVKDDLAHIQRLRPFKGDILVCLPSGPRKSLGMTAEIAVARWLRIPVIPLHRLAPAETKA